VLADGSERYAAAAAALAASARRRGAPSPVPDVVARWRDLGTVVQRAAPGRVVSDVLRDDALPQRERLGYAELLGRLLARVHATPLRAQPPWTAEDELSALESLLTATCHAAPAAGRSLAALVDRLADTVPVDADLALSHGAFRAGQVVLDGDRLCLLDLDTVSGSDAARDAGNALGYLSWADVRGALSPGLAAALRAAFLTGYADDRAAPCSRALAWWTAAAMAKIAGRRFRSLATAEWRQVPELLGRAAALVDPPAARAGTGWSAPVDPADPERMTDVLREVPALRAADRVRVVGARTLAEAAGRRRVVRYEVEGLAERAVTLIGKTYADRHRSWIAYDNLRRLADDVFAATPCLAVPTPVGRLPSLRMVLYREVRGTTLDRLPADAAVTAAGLAGRWLATLHGSEAVLARRLDLPHEVVDIEEWAACVADRAPGARPAAHALADRLAAAAADLPTTHEVPVHRDLHAGHVIAVPGGVVVIDLDEARMGDPALDVAHVTTYLDVSGWPAAPRARDAFLAGYGALPGPSPEFREAFFAACTCMKIAKQLVTGRGLVLAPPGEKRTAALTSVLRRGLACLDG
jgi:aminoglycoside phosphotransferase (APT) family kinase protein